MDGLDLDFFIRPGINLLVENEEFTTIINLPKEQLRARWNTPNGRSILTRWKTNGFRREILNNLVGRYNGHTDIRGINLSKEILQNIDLAHIDFFGAYLVDTTFERCNLTDSWLSHSNICGTIFKWATMGDVLIDDVEFDTRTKFIGVNLNAIDFTLASLLQELAIGQQKIEHLERRNPYFARFLRWTCDYGRSFSRFVMCCMGVILIFSLVYYHIPKTINTNDWLGCLYFSVVTFTTLGYGDICPISGLGRLIVIAEVSIGYIMLGLLVAIFSKRMIVA